MLVDTYDTLQGVRNAIRLARRIGEECRLTGVRLDSGDLGALSRAARAMLDEEGLQRLKIVASGGLNEMRIDALIKESAPIDIFGVGTDMSVPADAPCLDIAYKLTEFAGSGRMKLSSRKRTMPGRKQVFRREVDGVVVGDVIARHDEAREGAPLLQPVMLGGRRVTDQRPSLSVLRERSAALVASLRPALRALTSVPAPFVRRCLSDLRSELNFAGAASGSSLPRSVSRIRLHAAHRLEGKPHVNETRRCFAVGCPRPQPPRF